MRCSCVRSRARTVQRQLSLWKVVWASFRHHDEREIWRHYYGLTKQQRFRDGATVAGCVIARLRIIGPRRETSGVRDMYPRRAVDIAGFVTGETKVIESLLRPPSNAGSQEALVASPKIEGAVASVPRCGSPNIRSTPTARRWLPGQHCTPSWQAAYNVACLYALAFQQCSDSEKGPIAGLAVTSLRKAVDPRHSELRWPSEWIMVDPDLDALRSSVGIQNFRRGAIEEELVS